MLTKDDFVKFMLQGPTSVASQHTDASVAGSALPGNFAGHGFETVPVDAAEATDLSFAQRLMEASGFGDAQHVERAEVILGDNPAARALPERVYYWPKSGARQHQTILFELQRTGTELLEDGLFRDLRREQRVEDALHRLIQHAQQGFAKGGEKRSASVKQGRPDETLVIVSLRDDRAAAAAPVNLVCFGTVAAESQSFETFLISDEPRRWANENRPLAEEHLSRLYYRHFSKLAGESWQDAFVTGEERKLARKLLDACTQKKADATLIQEGAVKLVREIAKSFGRGFQAAKLAFDALPPDHFIGADPAALEKPGFRNTFEGMTLRDDRERLLGYIIYCLDEKKDADRLRAMLAEHNCFHNVLVIYPDGDQATLELWQGTRPLRGKLTKSGAQFHGEGDVVNLLSRFFVVSKSEIQSPKELARELARRARYLRMIALGELERERCLSKGHKRPVLDLYEVFDKALARQSEEAFSDSYAQTLTYGLLAARWMARAADKPFIAANVTSLLPSTSPFLKDLFQRLIDLRIAPRLKWLIEDLVSLLNRTAVAEVFENEARDPVIHFYEDFLDEYDPQLRKERGVYYTPDEVVSYIVRTAHAELQSRFALTLGLADVTSWSAFAKTRGIAVPKGVPGDVPFVQVLDPATGTGTFLLRVIEVVHETMMAAYTERGLDEVASRKEWRAYVRAHLLPRINGFELIMAPYIVSHLRLGLALEHTGFVFEGSDRLRIFLTNTLEVHTSTQLDWIGEHVAEEAREAERVKNEAAISVIVGNPPYEREPNEAGVNHKGGWVRDGWSAWRGARPLLSDYTEPASAAGAGGHLKNIYNLYVYFWRWATWRVFDRFGAPGIVSFITASSYLRGPGFVGMREEMRRAADDIYVLDLEGDQRGTRVTENVFCITIPVCVGTLVASAPPNRAVVANGHYRRVTGSRDEKLTTCDGWRRLGDVNWVRVEGNWRSPLMSGGSVAYDSWASLTNVFPWQHSGAQFKRTWPIDSTKDVLAARWKAMLAAKPDSRAELFRESRDRKVTGTYPPVGADDKRAPALASLRNGAPLPPIEMFGFRSFDRQWCIVDSRVGDYIRPVLWEARSASQAFMTSLLAGVVGHGPAATISAHVPDLHHFRGSYGGKDVIPLWRDPGGSQPNIGAGFLKALETAHGRRPLAEDVFAYAYAVLAHPGYVTRFEEELQVPGPRLPVTKNKELFDRGAKLGREVIRWHTFGERFRTKGDGFKLAGSAKVRKAIPHAAADYPERHHFDETARVLIVGDGEVGPVSPEVLKFSVSGLQVVKSWLDYRMKKGAGKKSSPLDDIRPERWTDDLTRELLEVLWVLEWTLGQYPVLDSWLDEVLAGDLFTAPEIPGATEAERKEPKVERSRQASLLG
jgi:hypothetical protein